MTIEDIKAEVRVLQQHLIDFLTHVEPTPIPTPAPIPPPSGIPVHEVKVLDAAGNSVLTTDIVVQEAWTLLQPGVWQADLTFIDRRPQPATSEFQAHSWDVTFPVNQPEVAPQNLYVNGTLGYQNGNVKFTLTGDKVNYVDTPKLGVALQYGWQQFPKAFRVTPTQITVSLHPKEASEAPDEPDPVGGLPLYRRKKTFYFNATGGAKTYRLLVRTGPGDMAALNAMLQTPPVPDLNDPKVKAIMAKYDIVPAGPYSKGYDDWLMNNAYLKSIKPDTGSFGYPLGWRDFGNRMRGGHAVINDKQIPYRYNDCHVGAQNFFIQYLRTGDRRWFDLGVIDTRWFMDLGVCHANRTVHGVRQNLGPGEPNLGGHDIIDNESKNIKLHDGHMHLSGLPLYVQLTGDARATEVLKEVGEWLLKFIPTRYKVPFVHDPAANKPHYAEAERDFGWCLYACNELYRTLGDTRYLDAAAQIVQHLIGWWQFPSDHIVNGVVVGQNRWQEGTGWLFMYPKQANANNNGTNPWMATALFANVLTFLKLDQSGRVDHNLALEMLKQCLSYVIKFGYNVIQKKFHYAEGSLNFDTGTTHYWYAIAVLGKLYPQEPWWAMAKEWFAKQALPRTNSTTTFLYGYEMIPWPEFWNLMQEG